MPVNKPKIDIDKAMAEFEKTKMEMSNLKPEDLDITPAEARELLKELEIIEAYALKIKADNLGEKE